MSRQIKAGKAPGPSGMVEMIRSAGEMGASMIRDLAAAIIRQGTLLACSKPVAWKGAHCCGYGPYTCMLIKKSDDDDDDALFRYNIQKI